MRHVQARNLLRHEQTLICCLCEAPIFLLLRALRDVAFSVGSVLFCVFFLLAYLPPTEPGGLGRAAGIGAVTRGLAVGP